jgi:hypothetical protein
MNNPVEIQLENNPLLSFFYPCGVHPVALNIRIPLKYVIRIPLKYVIMNTESSAQPIADHYEM